MVSNDLEIEVVLKNNIALEFFCKELKLTSNFIKK